LVLLRQSGVVDETTLVRFLEQNRAAVAQAASVNQFAGILVRGRLLTPFQAEFLLQGKWRGFLIGRYTVLEQIGAGGMGTVYLGEHRYMRRRDAIKVLPARLAADAASVERFYREARAVAALDHPNIVRAYEVGREGPLHFLAMEYVEGNTLAEMVKARGPLGILQAMHYARQAASGLQHAFEAGLIHRDIKPGNLLVDLSGTVKVLDLGLARFFNDPRDELSIINNDTVVGTVDYLAPEAAESCRHADIRSDLYSLGCTLYFCLTGQPPFPEGSTTQKLLAHQTRRPRPIRELRPEVPRDLAAVIDKLMAKRARQRFQTPAEVVQVLTKLLAVGGETAVGGMEPTLKESSRWRQRRELLDRWRQRWLLGGLVLLAAGVSALLLWIGQRIGSARDRKSSSGKPPSQRAEAGDAVQF
jgi:serine/threonine protein kinase